MRKFLMTSAMLLVLSGCAASAESGPATPPPPHGAMHHMHEGPFAKAMQTLPPEKADMIRKSMHKLREVNHSKHEQLHALREKQKTLIAADKFDKAAFLANARKERLIRGQMEAYRTTVMADNLAKLTAQERRDFLAAMPHPHGKHGWKHPDMHGDDAGPDHGPFDQ
jgi:Spy/CpxP family protein refolding chaperone